MQTMLPGRFLFQQNKTTAARSGAAADRLSLAGAGLFRVFIWYMSPDSEPMLSGLVVFYGSGVGGGAGTVYSGRGGVSEGGTVVFGTVCVSGNGTGATAVDMNGLFGSNDGMRSYVTYARILPVRIVSISATAATAGQQRFRVPERISCKRERSISLLPENPVASIPFLFLPAARRMAVCRIDLQ